MGLKFRKFGLIPAKADALEQARFLEEKLWPRLRQAQRLKQVACFGNAAHFVHGPYLGYLWCFVRLLMRGPLEGASGPGQAEQPLGIGGREALDAKPIVEGVGPGPAGPAGEIEATQRHLAGGAQEPPLGPALMTPGRAAGASPATPPFFSKIPLPDPQNDPDRFSQCFSVRHVV